MLGFMLFQAYGVVRIATVHRVFTWADPIYLIGLFAFFLGMNYFNQLLLRDAKMIRVKALRLSIPVPLASGEMPPEYWDDRFLLKARQAIRDEIKPGFLKSH